MTHRTQTPALAPYYSDDHVTLHQSDCLPILRALPDASVDAVVTDPPYGLSNTDPSHVAETITRWVSGDREWVPEGKGFMGKAWDAFVPPVAVWDECLRVLKPGGHLLAFAGSRTFDLMGLGIRLAGFDIRDSLAWLYGSGFPKSLDVSKAIDKAGGSSPAAQASVLRQARERASMSREQVAQSVGCTVSSVRDWEEGRARATGRAVEHITPSDTYRSALADLLGYTADERQVVGVGGGSRSLYETGHRGIQYGGPTTPEAEQWQGWGTALKPAFEPVVVARKPIRGTVAANVLEHGTGALNIDGCRIGDDGGARRGPEDLGVRGAANTVLGAGLDLGNAAPKVPGLGRWPANVVLDESQAAALDQQAGQRTSGYMKPETDRTTRQGDAYGEFGARTATETYGDTGGASRFFYTAKASAGERIRHDGIAHPTVKPLELMRWLVRLVTPPGGIVLEPFAGSGTTVEAALLEGFRCIAIEREADYLPLITQRLNRRRDPIAYLTAAGDDLGLFGEAS